MRSTRRQFFLGITAGAGIAALSACGGLLPTPTQPGSSTAPASSAAPASTSGAATRVSSSTTAGGALRQVRAGYIPIIIHSPIFVAMEKGYFKEQGIETVLTSFTGGTDILAQTASGNLDVGLTGLGSSTLNAFQRGLDIKIVSALHSESPPMATPLVVARKKFEDGTYKTVSALKGKRVAINAKGTGTEYWLYSALKKHGVSMKEIELVALPYDQVAAALTSGTLDGSMLSEPIATLAEDQQLITRIADDFLTNAQGTIIVYNSKWGRDNSSIADRWLAGWLRGARDLNNGGYAKDENARIVEKYTKTPADVIKRSHPPLHDPNGKLNLTDMQAQQEYFLSSGSLTYTSPLDLNTLIDTGYADRAIGIVGKA